MTTTGLRERKKQATRQHISDVATLLFAERGYDRVTIADVAAAAQVSKMTITNYFALKEDLVFDRREAIVVGPALAIRNRAAGALPVDAVRDWFCAGLDQDDPTLGVQGVRFIRLVLASPALQVAEREMWWQRELAIAEALLDGTAGPLEAHIQAAALSGVIRALHDEARRRLLAGTSRPVVKAKIRAAADPAFMHLTANQSPRAPDPTSSIPDR